MLDCSRRGTRTHSARQECEAPGTLRKGEAMTNMLPASPRLIGREAELEILVRLVDCASERGGALVVRGEPGVGKTSLLKAAIRRATDSGLRVLRTVGVQSETDLAFSGLHQLMLPVLTGADSAVPGQPTDR